MDLKHAILEAILDESKKLKKEHHTIQSVVIHFKFSIRYIYLANLHLIFENKRNLFIFFMINITQKRGIHIQMSPKQKYK